MNDVEFIQFASMTDQDLWKHCSNLTVNLNHVLSVKTLLELRREVQQALARYSRSRSEIDDTQKKAISHCQNITRFCRDWYLQWARKEILKHQPSLALKPQKLQGFVEQAWEEHVRKNSY